MLIWCPCWLSLRSRHIRYSLSANCQVITLNILTDLDESIIEELECPCRFEPEHLLQAHTLLHAHVNRMYTNKPHHLLLARRDRIRTNLECVVPVVRVLPESTFAFLHKQSVVEAEISN